MSHLPADFHRKLEKPLLPKIGELPHFIKRQLIIPPVDGWETDTLYLVHVSFNKGNPIHEAYMAVGFLTKAGQPAGYTYIWQNSYEHPYTIGDIRYIRVLRRLHTKGESHGQ